MAIFIVSLIIIRNLNIRWFAALHISHLLCYDDVCTIEKGDDIKDLTQIEPFTLKIQRNLEDGMQGLYQIVIYLTNEKTHVISFNMEGKVQASSELEDNIVRNPWSAEYYGGGDGIVGDEFSRGISMTSRFCRRTTRRHKSLSSDIMVLHKGAVPAFRQGRAAHPFAI